MVESHSHNDSKERLGSANESEVLPRCPVVGIGASAGGVKALQNLFEALPDQLNAAFVVVVHLDPNRQSELASILAGRTEMPVAQVSGTMKLEPNRVYVIPPNRRLVISDNEIGTAEFDEPRGRRLPIDQFFCSMAEHRGDGVAIVLTGSGADGALGIKAVKEAGGVVLVQEPTDAEYSSMPRSAIATGFADFVLPVPDIAARLVELLRSKEHLRSPDAGLDNEQTVGRILRHLRTRTGHDFEGYKRSTVLRRLARRMQIVKTDRLQDYLKYIQENVEELQSLFSDLLISVTAFFRDPGAFDALASDIIPKIFDVRDDGDCIRAWVPGCATGEEAYSIAMLLLEERARRDKRFDIQVFASDLDLGALATGREGRYPPAIEADVSNERLHKFFFREGDHYRVTRELRDVLLFANHSLLRDPPFSRLDLVSCRNLLIYLNRDLQQQACNILAYSLLPGGYMFLGPSEGVDSALHSVQPVDRQARIFQVTERQPLIAPKLMLNATPAFLPPNAHTQREPHRVGGPESHRQALEELAPPSILVDDNHRIINLSESAGRYLLHPGGPPTTDLTEVVRPELRIDLRASLHRAFDKNEASLSLAIPVQFNGTARQVHVQVRPQKAEAQPRRAVVLFIEGELVDEPAATDAQGETAQNDEVLRQLREELNSTRVRLRDTRQQYGEAIEELRVSNEELQSTNEEYRSTAEELETSKEELQSTNEELQTINNELKFKIESLGRAYDDIENLIVSTDVGTLFLDRELRIRRFTPRIADLFNIAESDEGRSITDFTHRLQYDDLASDAQAVLDRLTPIDKEVATRDGRWFLARLRPYRSTEHKIEGVVITLVDVTERRKAEQALRESEERYRAIISQVKDYAIFSADLAGRATTWNQGVRQILGFEEEEFIGQDIITTIFTPEDVRAGVADGEFRQAAAEGNASDDRWMRRKDGTRFFAQGITTALKDDSGAVIGFSKILRDMTPFKETEEALHQSHAKLREHAEAMDTLNSTLRESEGQLAKELGATRQLQRVGALLIEGGDINALCQNIVNAAVAIMGSDFASIHMYHPERGERGELHLLASHGFDPQAIEFWEWVRADSGNTCGEALRTGQRAIATNVEACDFMTGADAQAAYLQTGIYAAQSTPLISRSGDLLGMISTHWRAPHGPTEGELDQLDILARQAADLIERKQAEERQQLLMNELAHRGKNLLAVIQTIVSRSLSGSKSLAEAREALMQRLQALAHSQAMLVDGAFEGAPLAEIVRREFEALSSRVKAAGPDVMLDPKATQTFALLVHELATNAIKYGALSNPDGSIDISWSIDRKGPEARFKFHWQERGGPPVSPPTRQGFGRILIEKAAAQNFRCTTKNQLRP